VDGLHIIQQDEKRAALQELAADQLKELAEKHGLSVGAAAQQKSNEVCLHELDYPVFNNFQFFF